MSRHSAPGNESGFTLLELILALTVIAMIAAVSVVSVRLAVSSQQIGDRKTELYQRLRFIGEQLTEKIRSAHPVYLFDADQTLFANLKKDRSKNKRLLAFEGTRDSIRLITTSPRLRDTGERAPDLHEIRFYLGKNPKTGERGVILMERPLSYQTAMKDRPETLQEATFVTLATNVARLRFRYLQVKTVREDRAGETTKGVKYLSEWVDTIKAEPIEFLGESSKSVFRNLFGAEGRISLPRALEIHLALREDGLPAGTPEDAEEGEAPRLEVPPVMIPLYTGLVFQRSAPPDIPPDAPVKS